MNWSKQSISKGLVSAFATGLHDEAGPVLWARCSALLTRQALKVPLEELWQQRAPGVKGCSRHSPSLCLGNDLADDQLAARVSHT